MIDPLRTDELRCFDCLRESLTENSGMSREEAMTALQNG